MTLMNGEYDETFLEWVKQNQIVQITSRMNQSISVRDRISIITRVYQYQGDTCVKSRVEMI